MDTPLTSTDRYRLIQGDCLEAMAGLPAASVDAIMTDPPYGLSNAGGLQSLSDRIFNALRNIGFPDLYQRYAKSVEKSDLASVPLNSTPLSRKRRTVGVKSRVGMPEGAVDFNGNASDEKVNTGSKPPGSGVANRNLALEPNASASKFLGDYLLKVGDVNPIGTPGDELGSCLAEAFAGGFAVPVVAPEFACCCGLTTGSAAVPDGGDNVWLRDDTVGQAEGASSVVTGTGTVNALMLRFDLSGRPLELLATYRTSQGNGSGSINCTQLVRADAATSRLSAVAKSHRVRFVVQTANGTVTNYCFNLWTPLEVVLKKIVPTGGFMGKSWDAILPDPEVWAQCFRVLKPGGYLLAFGGTRVFHRLACQLENAGFELRETLMWLHAQGFPKGKGCLKPGWEPILLARKPGKGVRHLGIDACRVPTEDRYSVPQANFSVLMNGTNKMMACDHGQATYRNGQQAESHPAGRYPANVVHDGSKEVLEAFAAFGEKKTGDIRPHKNLDSTFQHSKEITATFQGDTGTAARFFYAAKASRRERGKDNNHPCVKPLALCEWLVKLICPEGGTCLDPFTGSGTTGVACLQTGRRFIGIELDPAYFTIAQQRLALAEGGQP